MKRFSTQARTLQWLDRRVGVPLCFALTLVRKAGALFGGKEPSLPVRSILFVKLAEQGSTVLAHEAIRRAVEQVGRENVHFLLFEENRFILDVMDLVPAENVHAVRTRSAGSAAVSGLKLIFKIRRLRFDACIDLEFFVRFSAAIAYLTGAPRRVGFHVYFGEGPYRGDLLTHRVLYNPHLHTSRTFTSLVLALGVDPKRLPAFDLIPPESPAPPRFHPGEEERAETAAILAGAGVPAGARLVILNANSSDLLPLRRWASASYEALAGRLLEAFPDLWVGFTGSAEEAPHVRGIVRAVGSPRCVSLAGLTTLRQLLILYGFAEVLVTNDSGPAHFASLTGIDIVALFGPETPLLFSAPGPRSHPLWAGIACSPCVNAFNNRQTACADNVCMQRITVDRVFEAVSGVLRSRASAGT